MSANSSEPGLLVITKSGKQGRTYHRKDLVNGKMPVYIDGQENPILCRMEDLNIIGYID